MAPNPPPNAQSSSTSSAAVIGIVVGVVALLFAGVLALAFFGETAKLALTDRASSVCSPADRRSQVWIESIGTWPG